MRESDEQLLRHADNAMHEATTRLRLRTACPGIGGAAATEAMLDRASVRVFANDEVDRTRLTTIACRATAATRGIVDASLAILVLTRRADRFPHADLVMMDGSIGDLSWTSMPVGGPKRPMPQADVCEAGGLLAVCGRRGAFPAGWGAYRALLFAAGFLSAGCAVQAVVDGLDTCLVSGINRRSFRESLGGASASLHPLMVVAVGRRDPTGDAHRAGAGLEIVGESAGARPGGA
jgi:hypothetical protein